MRAARSFRVILLSLVVATSSVQGAHPASAWAQSADDTSRVVAQARRAFDAGRPDDAIDQLKRAYQVSGEPALLFELAEVNREVGRNGEAIKFYQAYIRRQPNGPQRATAESMIAVLQAEPRTRPPAPSPVTNPPESRPQQVAAPIQQPPPAPVPAPVTTPAPVPALPPPAADATPGADVSVSATSTPEGSDAAADTPVPWWLPWVGVAATAGVGAAAIVAGTRANQRYDELAGSCRFTAAGCSDAEVDSVRSRARTANILWALTAAAGVGTGVLFIVNVSSAGVSGVWRF